MKSVRPSSLHIASLCRRSPWLAVRYPESRDYTRHGSAVDRQISLLLQGKELDEDEEILPETQILLDWLYENYPPENWEYHPQMHLTLFGEDGEPINEGTTDLVLHSLIDPRIVVLDWKSKGQVYAGRVPHPDENPQLLNYVAAAWQHFEEYGFSIERADLVLACWDLNGVEPKWTTAPILREHLPGIIQMVLDVPAVDPDGPEPEASIGDHCDECYQRHHCTAHLAPAGVLMKAGLESPVFAEGAGVPVTEADVVEALIWLERADKVLAAAKKLRDAVRGQCDNWAKQVGPVTVGEMTFGPVPTKARRMGATVATLEKIGRTDLIRPGKPGVKCTWYRSLKNGPDAP